jgi:hypothetical protein
MIKHFYINFIFVKHFIILIISNIIMRLSLIRRTLCVTDNFNHLRLDCAFRLWLPWCYPKFVSYIIISDSISSCVAVYLTQHPHFRYTHLLDVLSFCSPTLCAIHYRGPNCRLVNLLLVYLRFSCHEEYHILISISLVQLLFYD